MDSDLSIERARALRSVRANVNRANGGDRVHAYGWSIAVHPSSSDKAVDPGAAAAATGGWFRNGTCVPVPTYCRPLSGHEDSDLGMKIWCACAVDLSGGDASFPGSAIPDPHDDLDQSAADHQQTSVTFNDSQRRGDRSRSRSTSSQRKMRKSSSTSTTLSTVMDGPTSSRVQQQQSQTEESEAIVALETELNRALSESSESAVPTEKTLSTFVWLCSVSQSRSKVTVINIRSNPSEVLDSFLVKTHLLCIASVPGAKSTDFPSSSSSDDQQAASGIDVSAVAGVTHTIVTQEIRTGVIGRLPHKKQSSEAEILSDQQQQDECREVKETDDEVPPPIHVPNADASGSLVEKLTEYLAYSQPPDSPSNNRNSSSSSTGAGSGGEFLSSLPLPSSPVYQPMSTQLPTIWLGGQNCLLYVHSSIAQWSHCIASLKLPDSILCITHVRGRVFVALANGTCCVFLRRGHGSDGEWDFKNYYTIDVGSIEQSMNGSHSTATGSNAGMSVTCSIRCVEVGKGHLIWLGYRNLVFIIDPKSLKVVSSFPLHPRKESQVRQLSSLGDGVWCSLRLDSTLRLYSALKPFPHLQDIDVEPYVGKMLSPKSAFSFIRITGETCSRCKNSSFRIRCNF